LVTKEIKYEIDFDSRSREESNDMKEFQDEIVQSEISEKEDVTAENQCKKITEESNTDEITKELKEDNIDILETNVDNLNLGSDLTTNIVPVCDITTNDNLQATCGKSLVTAMTSWNFCLLVNIVIWLCFVSCLTRIMGYQLQQYF